MQLETGYLLNPGRKVRRRKGKSRRRKNARGWYKTRRKGTRGAKKRKVGKGKRRRTVYTRPKRKTVRSRRRRRNPEGASYSYANNSHRRKRGKRKSSRRRRRNPVGTGMIFGSVPQVLPWKVPLPGILGAVTNSVLQGVGAGAVVFTGYLLSGALVNAVYSKDDAEASDNAFVRNWTRPILFGMSAGLIAGLTGMIAPKGKKATFALLGAAGPGLRAMGGVLKAVMDRPDSPGIAQDFFDGATGLADYLQVGDLYEAGIGNDEVDEIPVEDAGVGDLYEAGMGWEAEDGMDDYLQVGNDAEVVGI